MPASVTPGDRQGSPVEAGFAAEQLGVLAGLGRVARLARREAGHLQPAARADPGDAAVVAAGDGQQAVTDELLVCG
jgi:hypothetical protein